MTTSTQKAPLRGMVRPATEQPLLVVAAAFLLLPLSLIDGEPPGTVAPAAQTRGLEIVGLVGGASGVSRAVALREPYVFVGRGPRLAVYDISDPTRPERVGLGPILPGIVQHLAIVGQHIIAATSEGADAPAGVFDVTRE